MKKIAVIGCGVLEWNIQRLLEKTPGLEVVIRILPAQLHNNPRRLRELIQEQIEALEQEPELDGICLAYGVCGRGTIGLNSLRHPLIIPRTQDCIGISLGSHQRYLEEFKKRPGTKYMTQGWYEKTIANHSPESFMSSRDRSLYQTSYDELKQAYGKENAAFILAFRESWKRNYQRSAYIRFDGEPEDAPGQLISEGTACGLGWEHQVLAGDDSLLAAMLHGAWNDPRLLVVPPHSRTVSAPGAAVIAFSSSFESQVDEIIAACRQEHSAAVSERRRQGLGLGIDTGGTFTDAVVYDFGEERILASAKAPTTHENLVVGIREAVAALPGELRPRIERVGISTTLATNAFVEKKGRPVALFLMSPIEPHLPTLPFQFVRKIAGTINMEGDETSPIDPEEIERLITEARSLGCEAFAVSGFGSVINPRHEQQVAEVIHQTTGLPTVCGHELTSHLNFMERAATAAMNAKLIPLIEHLLEAVRAALVEIGLGAVRVMVVKGDGSQMLDSVARRFPVETVLSGPAASVVGAAHLFKTPNAVVADMGGTTLDVAVVRDSLPVLSDRGARIGDFQTSVRGMNIRTCGLGGDSEIDLSNWPLVSIGPRRIIPFCQVTRRFPAAPANLDKLFQKIIPLEANVLDLVAWNSAALPQDRIHAQLAKGPRFLIELAEDLDRPTPAFIPWSQLETDGRIVRFGLTLTDIMHVQNHYQAYDREAANRLLTAWALLLDVDLNDIIDAVHTEFRRRVCDEIMAVSLPEDCPWSQTEGGLRDWLTRHLAAAPQQVGQPLAVTVKIAAPLIPVGAPTPVLFPQMETILQQPILLSEYAGVANAFGAIAGDVMLKESAAIRIAESGIFLCSWRGHNERSPDLRKALELCHRGLQGCIRESAAANDVPYSPPAITITPHQAQTRDGLLFLGVTMTAELRG